MWKPICTSSQKSHVEEAIQSIARHLLDHRTNLLAQPNLNAGGAAAIFFAYAADYFSDEGLAEVAREWVSLLLERAQQRQQPIGLFMGISGLIWSCDHALEVSSKKSRDESVGDDIDELLMHYVSKKPWPSTYDLIGGLVGFGVYAMERGLNIRNEFLEVVLQQLSDIRTSHRGHMVWKTERKHLATDSAIKRHPDGYFNLGVAHGVPGVVALLAECVRRGLCTELAKSLLIDAVKWLGAVAGANRQQSIFGYSTDDDRLSRAAWCYGDPGVFIALLRAAEALGDPSMKSFALHIGEAVCSRPITNTEITDPSLCHGSSGVAHILNCAYQVTNDSRYLDSALTYLDWTLDLSAQYSFCRSGLSIKTSQYFSPSFLTGSAGLGLYFLSTLAARAPRWDTPLLIGIHDTRRGTELSRAPV